MPVNTLLTMFCEGQMRIQERCAMPKVGNYIQRDYHSRFQLEAHGPLEELQRGLVAKTL
jgi:hypothetical protein